MIKRHFTNWRIDNQKEFALEQTVIWFKGVNLLEMLMNNIFNCFKSIEY